MALLSGCTQLYLEKETIETQISDQALAELGVEADVTCPKDLSGDIGATVECEIKFADDDEVMRIEVSTVSVDKEAEMIEYDFEIIED